MDLSTKTPAFTLIENNAVNPPTILNFPFSYKNLKYILCRLTDIFVTEWIFYIKTVQYGFFLSCKTSFPTSKSAYYSNNKLIRCIHTFRVALEIS